MNCCNANGVCERGEDCPARKQRIKETNDAYVKGYIIGQENPLDDLADTFKALITVITVTAAVTLLAFVIWGK